MYDLNRNIVRLCCIDLHVSVVGDVTGRLRVIGERPVSVGERDYAVVCLGLHGEAAVEWEKRDRQDTYTSPVVGCSSLSRRDPGGRAEVCTTSENGGTTLRFGTITFQSAGGFGCSGRDEKGQITETVNITVSVITPTSVISSDVIHPLSTGSDFERVSFVSDTKKPGRVKEGEDSTELAMIVVLICVSVSMTAFWLCLAVICCRTHCRLKGRRVMQTSVTTVPVEQ